MYKAGRKRNYPPTLSRRVRPQYGDSARTSAGTEPISAYFPSRDPSIMGSAETQPLLSRDQIASPVSSSVSLTSLKTILPNMLPRSTGNDSNTGEYLLSNPVTSEDACSLSSASLPPHPENIPRTKKEISDSHASAVTRKSDPNPEESDSLFEGEQEHDSNWTARSIDDTLLHHKPALRRYPRASAPLRLDSQNILQTTEKGSSSRTPVIIDKGDSDSEDKKDIFARGSEDGDNKSGHGISQSSSNYTPGPPSEPSTSGPPRLHPWDASRSEKRTTNSPIFDFGTNGTPDPENNDAIDDENQEYNIDEAMRPMHGTNPLSRDPPAIRDPEELDFELETLELQSDDGTSLMEEIGCGDSDHSSQSTDDQGLPHSGRNLEEAAKIVLSVIDGTQNGCPTHKHEQDLDEHMAEHGDNHYSLSATYQEPEIFRRTTENQVGLNTTRFPRNKGHPRRSYTPAKILRESFEGRTNDEDHEIKNICLHTEMEEVPDTARLRSFDIDSILAFPQSLQAFRRGFRYCPAQQLSQNIQKDIHVSRQVRFIGRNGKLRQQNRQLREIPHTYLGSVEGLPHCAVYIFFPFLIEEDRKFTYLTQHTLHRFFDLIFWPALRAYLDADQFQHLPSSQEVAELKAAAKGIESQSYVGERRLKQYAHYLLPPTHLGRIWEDVLSRTEDPELRDFREPFLFVNAKGVKTDFKVSGSLYTTMCRFDERFESLFDLNLMGLPIVDLGREDCPPHPRSASGTEDDGDEALSYLWRTCCLRHQHQWLVDNAFDGHRGQATFYHVGFLRDTACLTLTPPKKSFLYRHGYLYGQWYTSTKEIGDAQTCYPFSHPRLEELAIDEKVWIANASSAKVSHRTGRKFLTESYSRCKRRIKQSYQQAERTSFGARVECRVRWDLYQEIKRILGELEARISHSSQILGHPSWAWVLNTRHFTRFMVGNYDKFTSALELGILTSPTTGVTLERTRLLVGLLKCLRRFANSNLATERPLWLDEREVDGRRLRGLGFQSSVEQSGFGWFLPVVDWERLQFKHEVEKEIIMTGRHMLTWYRGSSRLLQDTNELMDICCQHLRDTGIEAREVFRLMAHLCFREFRRDVLKALKAELRENIKTDEERDEVQFCYEGLCEVFLDAPHLVRGNKTMAKQPHELLEWIWGSSARWPRKFFQERPFRAMYEKARRGVVTHTQDEKGWGEIFREEFLEYHRVIPYPDGTGTLISTAKGNRARQWYGIKDMSRGRGKRRWQWARGEAQREYPKKYPSVLKMNGTELKEYLQALTTASV